MITVKEAREKVKVLKEADCEEVIGRCEKEVSHDIEERHYSCKFKMQIYPPRTTEVFAREKNV